MLPTVPLSLAALAAAAAAGAAAQGGFAVGQAVQTSSGSVRGHAAAGGGRSGVSEYLGVPFAQPPVGDLRFAPPRAIDDGAGRTVDGADFGFSCLGSQLYPVSPGATGLTEQGRGTYDEWNQAGDKLGEDCLTLNVWTRPQDGEAKKAVMVWLYGGGFFTGGTSVPLYNGKVFADEQDVVVVTVNYRSNMFGFPGSPATQQNLGLLDVRMAIEWVSQNIAQFGGDPDRVVLFGQGAGAMAVDMLIHAFPQDPIVKGAILQSGSAATFEALGPWKDAQGAAALWSRTAAGLNCTDGDDAAVLTCMRARPAADLLGAQFPAAGGAPPEGGMAQVPAAAAAAGGFLPTIDNVTVFGDYAARTGRGLAQVPVLIGTNDNEGGLAQALGLANAGINITVGDGTATSTDREDAYYDCPSARRAGKSLAGGLPVWRYRYFGSFPNTQLLDGLESGAWHGSELGVLFGADGAAGKANTPDEDSIGTLMRGMWAAFAKNPAGGLDGFMGGVPRYSPGSNSLIRLGFENTANLTFAGGSSYDGDCAQLEAAQSSGVGQPQVAFGEKATRVNLWLLGLVVILSAAVSSVS